MTPDEFVRLKFGPIFDRIEETHGEIPEQLAEYLANGALVKAMVAKALSFRPESSLQFTNLHAWNDGEFLGSLGSIDPAEADAIGPDAIFALFTDGTDFIAKALGEATDEMQETQEARA